MNNDIICEPRGYYEYIAPVCVGELQCEEYIYREWWEPTQEQISNFALIDILNENPSDNDVPYDNCIIDALTRELNELKDKYRWHDCGEIPADGIDAVVVIQWGKFSDSPREKRSAMYKSGLWIVGGLGYESQDMLLRSWFVVKWRYDYDAESLFCD